MSTTLSQHTDCCFTGFKHEGEAVGKSIQFGGMETYISEPAADKTGAKKKILLYLCDIHGPSFSNNQLNCDYFASNGYTVLAPDYFFGDLIMDQASKPGFNRDEWRKIAVPRAEAAMPPFIDAVKEKYGTTDVKYAAVGYCFGAAHAVRAGATDLLSAAAFAHPGQLSEEDIQGIKVPLLMSLAETDNSFPPEKRRRAEDLLVEQKATYHIAVFSGVSHGFAVRGDPNDPNARWCKEESARGVLSWFDRFCN